MKCCCSRYAFGILIGAIAIVCSITFFIFECITLGQLSNEEEPEFKSKTKTSAIKGMLIYACSLIISVIFVYGIVKRKHKLLNPWIIFCIASLIGGLKVLIVKSIAMANGSVSQNNPNIKTIVICVSIIVADIAIICFSYLLYRKIRNENRQRRANIPVGEDSSSTEYTPVPYKS